MAFPYENVLIRFSPSNRTERSQDGILEKFSLSSKSLERFATPPIQRMGELDDKLSKFVKDTISFKGSLRENHAVMAGEFARSYMIGRESPNRLEIITSQVGKELGYQARKIIDTLCDGEGYIYLNGEASQGEDYEVSFFALCGMQY